MLFDQKKLEEWNVVDYGFTSDEVPHSLATYNAWVQKENHLPLLYLEGERQKKRQSLKEFWPDFQSAGVFLFSYQHAHKKLDQFYKNDPSWNGLKIASYTMGFNGLDYHYVIKERLEDIAIELMKSREGLECKIVLDTHPVLERDLAFKAGLGWFGKNSMMINRENGSFFIIGTILFNKNLGNNLLRLETDHCGQCTRCRDACPTDAIDIESRTIRANECISTFTIEQFKLDTVPDKKMTLDHGQIFGCDICQEVCPWNKRVDRLTFDSSGFSEEKEMKIINYFLKETPVGLKDKLEIMSEGEFKRQMKGTAFERSGRRGLLKNLYFYLKNRLI